MARSNAEVRVAKADPTLPAKLVKELIDTAKAKSDKDGFWFPNGIDHLNLTVSITRDGATVGIELDGPKKNVAATA